MYVSLVQGKDFASPTDCSAGDLNLIKVPSDLTDNQVLFLSDILATGWHATELGDVHDGDSVAIWGCGPGQTASFILNLRACHPVVHCCVQVDHAAGILEKV